MITTDKINKNIITRNTLACDYNLITPRALFSPIFYIWSLLVTGNSAIRSADPENNSTIPAESGYRTARFGDIAIRKFPNERSVVHSSVVGRRRWSILYTLTLISYTRKSRDTPLRYVRNVVRED